MSEDINLKVDKDLLNKVKNITKRKFPLRKIKHYSEAVREALFEFVENNKGFCNENSSSKDQLLKTEAST